EIDDALTVLRWILQQNPARIVYLAGFSFGAYIAAAVASRMNQQQALDELAAFKLARTYLVAPPVHHYPMDDLTLAADTLVLMGDEDEVVPPAEVQQWAQHLGLQLLMMPQCSHFFHGHLPDLSQQLAKEFP
ncbi:MAG: alpha/beta hydrolase, partial [Moraxellaceae bacterium]